jgi:RNA polymerase sigma-70 factor (ECF subfamily)
VSEKTSYNEKELFKLIAAGDEPAFETLFLTYVPRLQPVILSIVHSDIVAKDIIQEVFLRLWLHRHKLTDIEEPRNWIFKIAYNCSYQYLRRQLIARKANETIHRKLGAAIHNDTEESLAFAETVQTIQEAIRELPEQSRKIYMLSREQGLKINEIAASLDIAPQTVKNSLHRSGQRIKDYLTQKGIIIPLVLLTCSL